MPKRYPKYGLFRLSSDYLVALSVTFSFTALFRNNFTGHVKMYQLISKSH